MMKRTISFTHQVVETEILFHLALRFRVSTLRGHVRLQAVMWVTDIPTSAGVAINRFFVQWRIQMLLRTLLAATLLTITMAHHGLARDEDEPKTREEIDREHDQREEFI